MSELYRPPSCDHLSYKALGAAFAKSGCLGTPTIDRAIEWLNASDCNFKSFEKAKRQLKQSQARRI